MITSYFFYSFSNVVSVVSVRKDSWEMVKGHVSFHKIVKIPI